MSLEIRGELLMNRFRQALSGFQIIGPGLLVAATGVGAGDLATATFSGATLGTAVLWAVIVGAALKFLLNEGLTRWQLATGTTILEGGILHLGRHLHGIFLIYLFVWTYFVAMALMSACGVAAQAMFPLFTDPSVGKVVFGASQSFLAAALVMLGGYRLFEKVMSLCIGVMFFVVCFTAIALRPNLADIAQGLLVPTIPALGQGGLQWVIALLGGVGGTVTILCYGYWIREEGRHSMQDLPLCRLDLACGYIATAFFGLAMVTIGSQLGELDAKGATLIIRVAETLQERMGVLGNAAKWAFLIGAWGAFFSSLLGVWQSVPYLFADYFKMLQHPPESGEAVPLRQAKRIDSKSRVYQWTLAGLATIPISGLFLFPFNMAMKVNGIVGALFIPMLAVVLLMLNGREEWIGRDNRNSRLTSSLLVLTLLFFVAAGFLQIINSLGP